MTVNVQRNQYPVIRNLPDTITVSENLPVPEVVFRVQADDQDLLTGVSKSILRNKSGCRFSSSYILV